MSVHLDNELLTAEQAAMLLSLRPNTLAHWRCSGEGPPFLKIGRTVRYRLDDLSRWLEETVTDAREEQRRRYEQWHRERYPSANLERYG